MTENIGPYQVVGTLGRGGMGEVLLGRDPRLDREVAMKRVRLDLSVHKDYRDRFRREAKISAKLNHPAIVQVHDLIEGDTEDVLVMEYVAGPNLREYLKKGRYSQERLMELAAQIAAGLAEAHRNGVVHRDLKTENVLITPSGRAKITDFGIALQLDASLQVAQDRSVAGTRRAMSPEQALGLELDHRSDLFSFGTMLYEMFTGQSPFLADTPDATLQNIAYQQPRPLGEWEPKLLAPLVSLIHHLLSKKAELRPQHTQEVAEELGRMARDSGVETIDSDTMTWQDDRKTQTKQGFRRLWLGAGLILALITLIWAILPLEEDQSEPVFVAVLKATVNETDQVPADLLFAIREAAIEVMAGFKSYHPLDTEMVDDVDARPGRVAQLVAADEALTMFFRQEGARYFLVLRRISPDERILWSEALELPIDQYHLTLRGVKAAMTRAYPGIDQSQQPVVDAAQFMSFLQEKRSFAKRERPLEEHLARVSALRSAMNDYAPAYLLESDVARFLYHATREEPYLAMSFRMAEKGRKLAPLDSRPLGTLINLALEMNDLDRAEAELKELERLYPGDIEATRGRALLLEQQGQMDQALALLKRTVKTRPSWSLQFTLANTAFKMGETTLARQTLTDLLVLEPDHPRYLRLLALLELSQGSPELALTYYLRLTELAPSVEVWGNLATTQMLVGDYAKCILSSRQALLLAPNNSDLHLNLADCLYLASLGEEAFSLYVQVLELLDEDPTGGRLFAQLTRAQAQAHLGRENEARITIEKALDRAPKNTQVIYTAALVYAVLDDRASALAYLKQSYELGKDPRWFGFPWFDKLRDDPFFNDLSAP